MRVTVDIPDETLADLRRVLRTAENAPAVAKAVAEFIRCEKARDFALRLRKGELDYPMTNTQVEGLHG